MTIPAAPGRPSRLASLALRFGPVSILRPRHGMPAAVLRMLPAKVDLHLVDVREIGAPQGVAAVHWRLLTSHAISSVGAARNMLDQYRKRWIIEDYFRTLKTAGFQIEDAGIADPQVMIKFTALAAIAAVTVTQLLRARDNPSGQGLQDAFDPHDRPVIEALCKDIQGPLTNRTPDQSPSTRKPGLCNMGHCPSRWLDWLLRKARRANPQSRPAEIPRHQIRHYHRTGICVNLIAALAGRGKGAAAKRWDR